MKKMNLLLVGMLVVIIIFGGCKHEDVIKTSAEPKSIEEIKITDVIPEADANAYSHEEDFERRRKEFFKIIEDAKNNFENIDLENLPEVKTQYITIEEVLTSESKANQPDINGDLINIWNLTIESCGFDLFNKRGGLIYQNKDLYYYHNRHVFPPTEKIEKIDDATGMIECDFIPDDYDFVMTPTKETILHFPFSIRYFGKREIYRPLLYSFFSLEELSNLREKDPELPDLIESRGLYNKRGNEIKLSSFIDYNPKNGLLISFNEHYNKILFVSFKEMKILKTIEFDTEEFYNAEYRDSTLYLNYISRDNALFNYYFENASERTLEDCLSRVKTYFYFFDGIWVYKEDGMKAMDSNFNSIWEDLNLNQDSSISTAINPIFFEDSCYCVIKEDGISYFSSFDLKTGTEKWRLEIELPMDLIFLKNHILMLVKKDSDFHDLIYIDYESGDTKVACTDFYPLRQGIGSIGDSIFIGGYHRFIESSKFEGVNVAERYVYIKWLDEIPIYYDFEEKVDYEVEYWDYSDKSSINISNNTDSEKTFKVSSNHNSFTVSDSQFTLQPGERRTILVTQTLRRHGERVHENPFLGNYDLDGSESITVKWDDGEKTLPIRFGYIPYPTEI